MRKKTLLSLSFVKMHLLHFQTDLYLHYFRSTYHGLRTAWHCHWEG